MKKLIFSIGILFCSLMLSANNEPCKCSYPLKENTCWTVGQKGGHYCINKNGSKTYQSKKGLKTYPAKPKTTAKPKFNFNNPSKS